MRAIDYSHWHYAVGVFLISFVISFCMDVKPLYDMLETERNKQVELKEKLHILAQMKSPTVMVASVASKETLPDYWPALWSRAYSIGIAFKEIKLMENHPDAIKLHLIMKANFLQAYAFIMSLHDFDYPVAIADFSYVQSEKEAFNFALDFIIAKQKKVLVMHSAANPEKLMHHPICDEGNNNQLARLENDVAALQTVPLALLKMTGYFHQGLRDQALINLPGRPTYLVQSGSVLGKERAVVTAVSEDAVAIMLPNKKKTVIRRYAE